MRVVPLELVLWINRGQPEGQRSRVEVAASVTVALNEGPRPEVCEARSWRNDGLAVPACLGIGVLRSRM